MCVCVCAVLVSGFCLGMLLLEAGNVVSCIPAVSLTHLKDWGNAKQAYDQAIVLDK